MWKCIFFLILDFNKLLIFFAYFVHIGQKTIYLLKDNFPLVVWLSCYHLCTFISNYVTLNFFIFVSCVQNIQLYLYFLSTDSQNVYINLHLTWTVCSFAELVYKVCKKNHWNQLWCILISHGFTRTLTYSLFLQCQWLVGILKVSETL